MNYEICCFIVLAFWITALSTSAEITELENLEGKKIAVRHLSFSSPDTIKFKKKGDYRTFEMPLNQLSPKTIEAIKKDRREQAEKNKDTSIVAKIKANAAEEWPNDYTMQKFVIKRELEALKKLGTYLNKYENGPIEINKIMLRAFGKWPNDYTMILFTFERELKAYRELHQ